MGLGLLNYQGLLEGAGKGLVAGPVCGGKEPHLTASPGTSPKRRIKWEERQKTPSNRVEKVPTGERFNQCSE